MGHSDAVGAAGAGQTDKMFRADVGCEDRGPDYKPAEVPAREKVVICGVFVSEDYPPGDAHNNGKIQADCRPVP